MVFYTGSLNLGLRGVEEKRKVRKREGRKTENTEKGIRKKMCKKLKVPKEM